MSDVRVLAAEVGAKADLLSVALRSVEASLVPPQGRDNIDIALSWEVTFDRLANGRVGYRYDIAVGSPHTADFYVRAAFSLTYQLDPSVGFSDEQLAAFGEVSVTFSAFPYARELVQSLTNRAALPSLVLGTLRAPIDPPRDAVPPTPAKRARAAKSTKKAAAKQSSGGARARAAKGGRRAARS